MNGLVGQVIAERYHVVEHLGRGGMAEVYRVWDAQRMVHLAAKVLHRELALDRVFLRRFRREADTLAKLQHPHIVRSYGLVQEGRQAFLLLDYVEGDTLKEVIFDADGPLAEGQIRKVIGAIAGALSYAHSQGMIHCDIKPSNIMLHSNGTVFLSDFGIARMSDAATATMVGVGTPAYMAPEQIKGLEPTPQTDIYALGIVLFEMLTGGERPFTGERADTAGSTSEKVRWEQLHLKAPSPRKWNPEIRQELESVVLRCLEKEPENRFDSVLELLNALELALGEGTQAKIPVLPKEVASEPVSAEELPEAVKSGTDHGNLSKAGKPRLTSWVWGAVGVVVVIGIVLGLQWARPDGEPVVVAEKPTETETQVATNKSAPTGTATLLPTATIPSTETTEPTPEPTPIGGGSGKIVFASDRDGDMEIFIMDVDGGNLQQLTENNVFDGYPAWSPDGSKIAFISDRSGYDEIYVMAGGGHEISMVTDSKNSKRNLIWRSENEVLYTGVAYWERDKYNGRTVYTTSPVWEFFTTSISGGTPRRIPIVDRFFLKYQAIPDSTSFGSGIIFLHDKGIGFWEESEGQEIMFYEDITGRASISSVDVFESDRRILFSGPYRGNLSSIFLLEKDLQPLQISQNDGNYLDANWSPDGKSLICVSDRDGDEEIYILNLSGKIIVQLTDSPGFDGQPDWAP